MSLEKILIIGVALIVVGGIAVFGNQAMQAMQTRGDSVSQQQSDAAGTAAGLTYTGGN